MDACETQGIYSWGGGFSRQPSHGGRGGKQSPVNVSQKRAKNRKKWCVLVHFGA